jgi:DNA-binding NtrC family response regulator
VLLGFRHDEGATPDHELVAKVKVECPEVEIVVLAAPTELARVMRCLRSGAFDCVEQRRVEQDLLGVLERAAQVAELRRARLAHQREAERLLEEERRLMSLAQLSAGGCGSGQVATPPRLRELERRALADALRLSRGNMAEAARTLGITKYACWRRAHKYGLVPGRGSST